MLRLSSGTELPLSATLLPPSVTDQGGKISGPGFIWKQVAERNKQQL